MLRRSRVSQVSQDEAAHVTDTHSTDAGVAGERLDAARLRAIYEEHLAPIYRYIYAKVGNREEAEDLTAQVFVKALRGLDGAFEPHSVQAWLFQVARTTIADHWRAFYRLHADSLDILVSLGWEPTDAAATASVDQIEARAQHLLERVSSRHRDVLTYRFLLNYSIRETAEAMRLSEANVKVLQFRALKEAARIAEVEASSAYGDMQDQT